MIHLVRENLRLLHELVTRYEVGRVVCPNPAEGERNQVEIRGPAGIVRLLEPEMAPLQQEQLRVVLLDTRNRVLGTSLVYQGGLNTTAIASLADFFREAVRAGAHALVLVHNHPSGDPTPSPEDIRTTSEIGRAGDLLGIEVLDHIVIGRGRHVSLREAGLYAYHPQVQPIDATGPAPGTPALASVPLTDASASPGGDAHRA